MLWLLRRQISKLLVVDPKDRLTADEALSHPFFKREEVCVCNCFGHVSECSSYGMVVWLSEPPFTNESLMVSAIDVNKTKFLKESGHRWKKLYNK